MYSPQSDQNIFVAIKIGYYRYPRSSLVHTLIFSIPGIPVVTERLYSMIYVSKECPSTAEDTVNVSQSLSYGKPKVWDYERKRRLQK
mmetsp:Transcript_14924/g.22025  ORF Transcript_14924/g.22025 Transcript_14924/m.22025 type:complete len:87 (-) Transcript_14924:141-401(-)